MSEVQCRRSPYLRSGPTINFKGADQFVSSGANKQDSYLKMWFHSGDSEDLRAFYSSHSRQRARRYGSPLGMCRADDTGEVILGWHRRRHRGWRQSRNESTNESLIQRVHIILSSKIGVMLFLQSLVSVLRSSGMGASRISCAHSCCASLGVPSCVIHVVVYRIRPAVVS